VIRVGVLLSLAAAAVEFLVDSAEYPGSTSAGRGVLVRDILPLVALAWLHLLYLSGAAEGTARILARPRTRSGPTRLLNASRILLMLVDAFFLVWTLPAALRGAPPLQSALPIIAGILLIGVLGNYAPKPS
jgi:hypothetical protein